MGGSRGSVGVALAPKPDNPVNHPHGEKGKPTRIGSHIHTRYGACARMRTNTTYTLWRMRTCGQITKCNV